MEEIRPFESTTTINKTLAKNYVANVFSLMFTALIISGLAAIWFATDEMKTWIISPITGGFTTFGWITMFSPLALVFLMGMGLQKFNVKTLLAIFLAYSTLTGISLSTIFSVYSTSSIATTFFISSITFGIMAVAGYTTKTDLTKMGSLLFMGLIGIVIASLVNIFLGNGMLDIIISIVGVLVFTGLTAYDVQKIKKIGMVTDQKSEMGQKLMIMGALTLYLDFINLFLMLLRLFGNRD